MLEQGNYHQCVYINYSGSKISSERKFRFVTRIVYPIFYSNVAAYCVT